MHPMDNYDETSRWAGSIFGADRGQTRAPKHTRWVTAEKGTVFHRVAPRRSRVMIRRSSIHQQATSVIGAQQRSQPWSPMDHPARTRREAGNVDPDAEP
jgi:hypothetical protein